MTVEDPVARSPGDVLGLGERNHPLRAALSYEMHVRKLPRFATPCRLLQVVTLLGEGGAPDTQAHIDALCRAAGLSLAAGSRFAMLPLGGGMDLVWERHTEVASYMFVLPGPFAQPFDPAAFVDARKVLDGVPGLVIRATQIALLGRDAPDPSEALIAESFVVDGLVVSDVAGGRARLWSDFQLNADGFGRLLIADRGLSGDEPAQLVQRVQELGNYRNMALLGLPLAQRLTPDVTALEQRLAKLTHGIAEHVSEDDRLLDELTFLSAELARLLAETRYRMNATRAYAQIVADRLESLAGMRVAGFQTLDDFTERRLMPAVRTCESFSLRLEDLSRRASWASALLRTRIDTALARQNRDLLASMDRRTRLQLRLQQTVEGLSIVAISYYLVGLVGYVVKAAPSIPEKVAMGVATPIVLAGVAWYMSRLRRQLKD